MADVRLVRVVAPHFVAGMLVDADRRVITEAAPILGRWKRRSWDQAWQEMRALGWDLEAL